MGGEHLHAAAQADEIDTLFPTRPVHVDDWVDAQPEMWSALPVRELYAPGDLWPPILSGQLEPSASVLVLTAKPQAKDRPGSSLARFWRRLLQGEGVVGYFVPRSNGPSLRQGMARDQLERLATEVVAGEEPLLKRLREVQPPVEPALLRHIMVFCAPADLAIAERLSRAIHGERDGAGRTVECWVVVQDTNARALQRLAAMQLGLWRHAALLFAQLLAAAESRSSLRGLYVKALVALMGRDWTGEFEVVVMEGRDAAGANTFPFALIEHGVESRIVRRLIAVRPPSAVAAGRLAFPAALYAGEIRVADGQAADIDRRSDRRKTARPRFHADRDGGGQRRATRRRR